MFKRMTPSRLKVIFNIYPPLIFNRTWLSRVSDDYQELDVKLRFSLLNRNFNGSIFGGSIFMTADPYYPIMYRAALNQKNIDSVAWLKKAEIEYLKPAHSDLLYQFRLTQEDIDAAEKEVKESGRFQKWNTVEATDKEGDICARIRLLSYLKSDS